jgi:aspartate racemase
LPKHIGIVAVSPEGSSFCYRLIGRRASEIPDPARRPLISMHNRPFSNYLEALDKGDWVAFGQLLAESASVLAGAGAQFCVLPDNVAHHALHLAEARSPIPWLNMIQTVADAVAANGCQKVGLIGTKYVTFGSTYQTLLGLKGMHLLVPPAEEAEEIDRIIFKEAIFGRVRKESRQRVLNAIKSLGERGCDAVIFASSEASLLLNVEDSPLPVFDPVELLAEAAIRHATA